MIKKIIEINGILEYLQKRQLVTQYKKAKNYLLNGYKNKVFFKKRKPYTSKIYQFRINNKYRAFGYFDIHNSSIFRVIEISDHQD